MLRHVGDVVQDHLVGVARGVLGVLRLAESDGTDDSGLSVLKGGVSAEVGSLFLIGVLLSHCFLSVFCSKS